MEKLEFEGEGYRPLVLTRDWQVAQLNAMPELLPEALALLDQHDFTDETFTLLRGRAFLITGPEENGPFALTPLALHATYNVPVMTWHNIAMEPGSSVLISEGRDAHLKGCRRVPMPEALRGRIRRFAAENWT